METHQDMAMLHANDDAQRRLHLISHATPAFFRMTDVVRITALSRATLYRRIAEGKFPQPVHLGGRACGWSSDSLRAWIDDPEGYSQPPQAARRSGNR